MYSIATLWFPNTNPIGVSSLFAVIICAGAWTVCESRWLRSDFWRGIITVLFPVLFLYLMVFSPAPMEITRHFRFRWHYRTFPNVEQFVANYVYLAVGFIIALKAARLRVFVVRSLGIAEVLGFLIMIVFEANGLYDRLQKT